MFSLFNLSSFFPWEGQLTPICPYVRTPMNANVVAETVEQIEICRVHEVRIRVCPPRTFERFLLHRELICVFFSVILRESGYFSKF